MIIHEFGQRSAAWYKMRLGKVTASNAHRLLTPAKFKSYFIELLAETITQHITEHGLSEAMEWGIEQEPFAAEWYEKKTGRDVMVCGFIELEGMNAGCSPDLIVDGTGMAQIKCPTPKMHAQYMIDGPSSEIVAQMQYEMFCFGAEWNDFVTYDPRWPDHLKGNILRIERSETMIDIFEHQTKEMKSKIDEFILDKKIVNQIQEENKSYIMQHAKYLMV